MTNEVACLGRTKFEDFLSVRFVPRPVRLPQHDVEVEQESQVGRLTKPVNPDQVVATESEVASRWTRFLGVI